MQGKDFAAKTGTRFGDAFGVTLGISFFMFPIMYGLITYAFPAMSFAKAMGVTGKAAIQLVDILGGAWILFALSSTLVFMAVLLLSQHPTERLRAKIGLAIVTIISGGVLMVMLNVSGYSLSQNIDWGSGNVFLDALIGVVFALFTLAVIVAVFGVFSKFSGRKSNLNEKVESDKNKIINLDGVNLKIIGFNNQESVYNKFDATSSEQLKQKINILVNSHHYNSEYAIKINGQKIDNLENTDIKNNDNIVVTITKGFKQT